MCIRQIPVLILGCLLSLLAPQLHAQTAPTAHSLSGGDFTFTGFGVGTTTTYPTSMQGHTYSSGPYTTANLTTDANGDAALANSTSGATSGSVRNEVASGISMLYSGTVKVGGIVVAINTTGRSSVTVSWTAAQVNDINTRVSGVRLQYRVGTSGAFTDVASTEYLTALSGTASAQNFSSISLPSAVDNQSVVHLRWVYYDSSGSGGRDRIRIDDITISSSAAASAPSVSTVAASATNTTTATVNGNVSADGGATVSDRGVCYKTSTGVTLADNKTASGSGTGTFAVNLSSLTVNQLYYFKAYATNTAGATLGSELSFTTLANVPGVPTVANATASSLDVTIAANGNPAGTAFAILCTNSGQYVQSSGALGASAVWQTAAVWGTKTVTGLSSSQEYGFQVKARNGENVETALGTVGNGTTAAGAPTPTPPAVSVPTASAVGTTTATLGGTIDSTNNASATERGVYWSTSSGFTPPGQGTVVNEAGSFGNGAFTLSAGSLPAGSTIYFKAYASNSAGSGYSSES